VSYKRGEKPGVVEGGGKSDHRGALSGVKEKERGKGEKRGAEDEAKGFLSKEGGGKFLFILERCHPG